METYKQWLYAICMNQAHTEQAIFFCFTVLVFKRGASRLSPEMNGLSVKLQAVFV